MLARDVVLTLESLHTRVLELEAKLAVPMEVPRSLRDVTEMNSTEDLETIHEYMDKLAEKYPCREVPRPGTRFAVWNQVDYYVAEGVRISASRLLLMSVWMFVMKKKDMVVLNGWFYNKEDLLKYKILKAVNYLDVERELNRIADMSMYDTHQIGKTDISMFEREECCEGCVYD